MNNGWLLIVATALGALIGFGGQEVHSWRQGRRRFDEARRVAYTNLIAEAFRTHNAFTMMWSPFSLIDERERYLAFLMT